MMFVLDASAVLALLLEEAGAAQVMAAIRHSEISIVNMCEVITKVAERGGDPDEAYGIIVSYGVKVREFREAHAIEVARLRPITRHLGLSLGDRACLAQGRIAGLPILTSDTDMAKADLGLDIRMIR
jgi:ribonuclease VapC